MYPLVRRCMLLLLLLPAAAWSQQTADPSVSTSEQPIPVAEGAPVDTATVETPDGEIEEVVDPDAMPAAVESLSESSTSPPDDYRASEQISDDLSVSFPVDI